MFKNFGQGFVFYGSLIFVIPISVWYFRKEKWPVWSVFDRLAITGTIIHACGRMGCFLAGCCYGIPTGTDFGLVFSHPHTHAEPIDTHLHPTQLYEVGWILFTLITLVMFKRHNRFKGKLIFVYIIMYAVGRSIIEIFRGDLRRGFVIDGVLSHSQFISILIVLAASGFYWWFYKKKKPQK